MKKSGTKKPIRFLVENYYDVQKLRIEAFNRLVAFAGSHSSCETPRDTASEDKTVTQQRSASHPSIGTQRAKASQNQCGPHRANADVKPSEIANRMLKGLIETPKEIDDLVWYHNRLYKTEKQLVKRLEAWSKAHPLRINFLSRIQGIGPILSSALIAWLEPIDRFSNISKLWKYCGLAPGQKRKRGQKLDYNPRLKTLMWKVASSFEKQKAEKSFYRRIYQLKKTYYLNREDLAKAIDDKTKGAKLHVRLMSMRFTVKRFLADLWLFWTELEGREPTQPYIHTIKGHTNFEEWIADKPAKV